MKNLTSKEKEMLSTWAELFGKDSEKYKKKVDEYFKAKKEINEFLGEKGESEDKGLFNK